jgi:DNA/RNA endonuclease G (NUC1)
MKTVGKHQMGIPSHFFKIILIQTPNGIHEETYVLPNKWVLLYLHKKNKSLNK